MVVSGAARIEIEAEPEEVDISRERLTQLTDVMKRHVDAHDFPGFATLVGRQGKVVQFETYGSMDDEAHKPLGEDTIYRIYSMTKPIASVALLALFEENRFGLDEPASKYIPELRDLKVYAGGTAEKYDVRAPSREPSIRDMLTHTPGFTSTQVSPLTGVPTQIHINAGFKGIPLDGTLHDQMKRIATMPLECD